MLDTAITAPTLATSREGQPADLTRTAAALNTYDAASAAVDGASVEESETAFDAYDAALVAVAEAFATDTADRNRHDDAFGVVAHSHSSAGLKFVRRLVADFLAEGS